MWGAYSGARGLGTQGGAQGTGKAGCGSHMDLQLGFHQQGRLVPGQEQGTLTLHRYGIWGDGDSVGLGFVCSNCDDLEVGMGLVLVAWPWWCSNQLSLHMQPWKEESVGLEQGLSHGHLHGHPQYRQGVRYQDLRSR